MISMTNFFISSALMDFGKKLKMYDIPQPLENLCLDSICDNLRNIFHFYYVAESNFNENACKLNIVEKFKFKDTDMFLFNELSEKLFNKLGEKDLLCDTTLSLFTEKNTRLRTFKLKNADKVTHEGLKVLKHHKIVDLEITNLKSVCISKILGQYWII